MTAALAAAVAFLGVLLGIRPLLGWLERRRILDHPNERSSHVRPTPRGGGLAVTPAVMAGFAVVGATPGPFAAWAWVGVAGCMLLLVASWADDRHSLPPAPRLLAHAGVVAGALLMLPDTQLVFQGWLPFWADRLVAALGWLWFINLFNFMDGIDGISGVETVSIGTGVAVVATLAGLSGLVPLGLACAAAGLAFLRWNWHPAKIFLGDSGSVPLGFVLGGLLLQLAAAGELAAALILPLYYLADATITLLHRLKDGEKVWQAHRRHFYQRAVKGGRRHDEVSRAILAADLALIGAAVGASLGHAAWGLATAALVVALLLGLLQHWSKGRVA